MTAGSCRAVLVAANLPPHLNVNSIELMPVSQSWAGFAVERHEG